jgi:hypothetical protein
MEQKLEVKHLSPYLTYKLKLYAGECFVKNNLDVILDRLDITTKAIDASNLNGVWFIDQIKPILRPLSDLTNIIEVNGGWFYPLDVIYKIWYEKDLSPFSKRILNDKICLYPESMPYWLVQKLIEWHFDIFGLIEKGLAIDINTLKK